jgi:predicted metal-dependent hydrolase
MKDTFIPELGKVSFITRKQSKRITVRYDPSGKIKVSLPKNISYKTGVDFIQSKKSVIKHKVKLLQQEQQIDDLTNYRTKWHQVQLKEEIRGNVAYQICDDKILIKYPPHTDLEDPSIQSFIRCGIEDALRLEAKYYLPKRIRELSSTYHFQFNNVYIKNVKTLWGSCSSKDNINLNIHLMRLPDHLIDYVLLHELCHTVYKNHSPCFWKLLDNITCEDVYKLKAELKNYIPRLM